LLALVQRHRATSTGYQNKSKSDFLLHFVDLLTGSDGVSSERLAIARALALLLSPGPDASGAIDLLRDARIGDFALDDLEEVRGHPRFADLKEIITPTLRDGLDGAELYIVMRAFAVEAGGQGVSTAA
jgi:hypothetical protein